MYISKDFINGLILFTLISAGMYAKAEVVVEETTSNAIFMINGRQSSPVDAQNAARTSSNKVEKCTPIKGAITSDGKPAYKCKVVALVINPKTGTTKWKNL